MRPTFALLAVPLALLTLAVLAPAASAAPLCYETKVGWTACVNPAGACTFAWLEPPFTDFWPGAGACQSVATGDGVTVCAFDYVGFATLGGWNGVWADACAGTESGAEACAFAGNSYASRPLCI